MATLDSRTAADVRAQPVAGGQRLRGWKEIGRFFGVDERTAKRWEGQRGLPVHRVPGEPTAPVFAYVDELQDWVEGDRAAAQAPLMSAPSAADPEGRRPWLTAALVLLVLVTGVAVWLGVRAADDRRLASTSTQDLKRLASAQVAVLNDQLDSPPGTVAVRAALAEDAVEVLGRVAARPDADLALRWEAAEGYRRLAVLQNAIDRPSLRDRKAALASIEQALALLAGQDGPEAADVRARVRMEAARQAGGAGDLKQAEAELAAALPVASRDLDGELAQEWWLARAEVSGWSGDHAGSLDAARRVTTGSFPGPLALLRELKARDLEAEALYYRGDLAAAERVYGQAVATAQAAVERWPTDTRFRWALLRQQWNLGSTLVTAGKAASAAPVLAAALAGWEGLARADPSDEALGAWVKATRLSHGQALEAGGQRPAAIAVLSEAVAERRVWHRESPGDADRRRMLMKGLLALGDALGRAGRSAEACLLFAEAVRIGTSMELDRQLTGFDTGETLRLLAASRRQFCSGQP
jgi:tetratricopeptide (TPR) repeat protein